jgi:chemotaxis protein methyltransferase CheR
MRHPDDPHLSIGDFRTLSGLLQTACGQDLAPEMRATVERKLRDRLLILGLESFAEYFRLLRADPKARDELLTAIELISTHET